MMDDEIINNQLKEYFDELRDKCRVEFAFLVAVIETYGKNIFLIEYAKGHQDTKKFKLVIDYIQNFHENQLINNIVDENAKKIVGLYNQSLDEYFQDSMRQHINNITDVTTNLVALFTDNNMSLLKYFIMSKNILKEIALVTPDVYYVMRKVFELIKHKSMKYNQQSKVKKLISSIDIDTLNDIKNRLTDIADKKLHDMYNDIIYNIEHIDNVIMGIISVHDLNLKIKYLLSELLKLEYKGSIKFINKDKFIFLNENDDASKLCDLFDDDILNLSCRKSYRKDVEETVLMHTPPAPRLRISRNEIKDKKISDLVNIIPKTWNNKTLNNYFSLSYSDHIIVE